MLQHRGDLAGAEAAFRRGDAVGDQGATYELGCIFERRNDLTRAVDAYERASTSSDEELRTKATTALHSLRSARSDQR
jgi:hypothetical protein